MKMYLLLSVERKLYSRTKARTSFGQEKTDPIGTYQCLFLKF